MCFIGTTTKRERRIVQIDFLIFFLKKTLFIDAFIVKIFMQNMCIMKCLFSSFASHCYLIVCFENWCFYPLL
jgi:hypothetical protein